VPIGISVRNPLDPHAAAILESLRPLAPPDRACLLTRGAAMAVGEQWCGAATGARHVVALTLDEYVHAGIAVDGRPFQGAHGLAGAAGWLSLNPVDREDYRKLGCLEAEVGLAGIARRLVWRLKAGDHSRVLEAAGGDLNAITARHVFEGARAGDGVAISVMRDTARYIGMAVANLAVILDPEAIVLGGAIADASDLFLEAVHAEVVRRLPPPLWESLTFTIAALGDDAAPLGAARAALLHT
jgi:glucokinase